MARYAGRSCHAHATVHGRLLVLLFLGSAVCGVGCGGADAPVQSNNRPLGLSTVGPVKASGTDWRSWWFERRMLPSLITLANREFSHRTVVADYEDCVVAVEMSASNVEALIGTIDPWRRIRQLLRIAGILAVLLGGPLLVAALKRRAKRRRLARAYEQAKALLESSQPGEALGILQGVRKDLSDHKTRDQWARLKMTALEQIADVENLCDLYEQSPALFAEREPAALSVGRAHVEQDQFDAFATVRSAWRDREQTPEKWLCLDADVLLKQDKELDALQLLTENRFEGRRDCARVARLASLQARERPDQADALLAQAVGLDPHHPDGHAARAAYLEAQGKYAEAIASYQSARACAPNDSFLLNRLADAYRRGGDYAQALRIWCEGLKPPSMGFLWVRVLFWSRVALPAPVDWNTLDPPVGPLRPLMDFLLRLDADRFWDAKAFASIAERQPELLSRQEVFWLRVLESLRNGSESEALSLLNLQGFGARSWHAALETALLRMVIYRRRGFLGTPRKPFEESAARGPQHPFFVELDGWTQHRGIAVPETARQFLRSEYAFTAACLAAGWTEAGLRLLGTAGIASYLPDWLKQDIQEAVRRNRDEAAAQDLAANTP